MTYKQKKGIVGLVIVIAAFICLLTDNVIVKVVLFACLLVGLGGLLWYVLPEFQHLYDLNRRLK